MHTPTLLFLRGISPKGTVVAKTYASLVCMGPMEGRLNFDSYATALLKGDVSGQITSESYFDLVVTGRFSGRILANSYAMIYLVGGCDGSVELKHGAKVYIAGRTTEASLSRVKGQGNVFLEDSDLPPGEHKIGDLSVTVAGKIGQALPDIAKLPPPVPMPLPPVQEAWPLLPLEQGPLQLSVPAGWTMEYRRSASSDFYSAFPHVIGGFLAFYRWSPGGKPEDIPAEVRKMAGELSDGATKESDDKVSKEYDLDSFAGDDCKGTYAVFRVGNTNANMVLTVFIMSVEGQLWHGQFSGKTERWKQAMNLLKSISAHERAPDNCEAVAVIYCLPMSCGCPRHEAY